MLRIAVFFSHPTQHFSPLFRSLAALDGVGVHVYYFHAGSNYDPGFNKKIVWDVPLLDGYNYSILPPLLMEDGMVILNRSIIKAINSNEWDAILISGYGHLNSWLIAFYAAYKRIPVVYMSDSTILNQRSLLKRISKQIVVRIFFKTVAAFLCCGDHNYSYYRHYGVNQDEKLFWSPLPVNIKRIIDDAAEQDQRQGLLRQRYDIPADAKIVLFAGKFIYRKRPLDLVHAIKKIDTGQKIIALFIGDGPLRGEILKIGGDTVRVTGFINQKEIGDHFALGSILVMPSEYDPHPLVVTEAAVLGIPAIVSDKCGCYGPHDILRHGENGYIYKCGDIEMLATLLSKLLTDDTLRNNFKLRSIQLSLTQDCTVAAKAIINTVNKIKYIL